MSFLFRYLLSGGVRAAYGCNEIGVVCLSGSSQSADTNCYNYLLLGGGRRNTGLGGKMRSDCHNRAVAAVRSVNGARLSRRPGSTIISTTD